VWSAGGNRPYDFSDAKIKLFAKQAKQGRGFLHLT